MGKLRQFWRSVFDVREGEYGRVLWMTLYLMLVLFAYYILKPVSRAIFLNRFDIDKLPWLYVLIASVGGVLAYFYTKLAVNTSLRRAVDIATIFSTAILVLFWWLIHFKFSWIVYAFNIWVSLFSIILVSQGWLVAANVFSPREAKRVYGILGVGSVIGAAFGGSFTAYTVRLVGTNNLVLASAVMVILSYGAFLGVVFQKGVSLSSAKAAEEEEEFSFAEILTSIRRNRHLQVIIAIIAITFMVDVLVEFQFSYMAKQAHPGKDDLTAFLGNFYGFWLNLVTFGLQFFLTSFVVSRFGVGGTLQIMPVSIAIASIATLVAPSEISTAGARLTEASTRYSFNKTGMELLYLPLPLELRNRTKAFVDIFVDRLARGMGGMILVFFTTVYVLQFRNFSLIVMALSILWIFLSVLAKREYFATVRKRLESRRLDLESARISPTDTATVQLLEQAARGDNPRQASYGLSLLATAPGYNLAGILEQVSGSTSADLRGRVYELAASNSMATFKDKAMAELRNARQGERNGALRPAVQYVLAIDQDSGLAARLLEHANPGVAEAAAEWLASNPKSAESVLTPEWIEAAAKSERPERRRLAAVAMRATPQNGASEHLTALLSDPDPGVATAAFVSAAANGDREYLAPIIRRLPDAKLRGAAVDALAGFGAKIVGTLGDLLADTSLPIGVRKQVPRVLRLIPEQRSVDVLLQFIKEPELELRAAVLRALNRLRENAPNLNYGGKPVYDQILAEARYYYDLNASLAAFQEPGPHTPVSLLAKTLEQRLQSTIERLFRLLGLKYPQQQIYAAWLAVHRGKGEHYASALEFLDNVLERDLKRFLLPMLDDPARLTQRGHELFGIEARSVPEAIREIMRSGDEWLIACAMAAAAELGLKELSPEISGASSGAGADVSLVAQSALAALS